MDDLAYMQLALAEARAAAEKGEVPVGCVIVLRDRLLARAGNCTISACDPSAHAEIIALRAAAKSLGNYRLNGAVVYVTVEPCAMCAGAMIQARIEQDPKILKPAPFSPPFKTGKFGSVYEIRQYIYQSGTIPKVIEAWIPLIEARMKLSPMVGCWYTDIGPLHQWVHIWPFQDASERQRVRAEAVERKMWPPVTAEWLLRMQNCLALPASFSPLR